MVYITYSNFKTVDMEKLENVCRKYGARIDRKTKRIYYAPSAIDSKAFYHELDECAENGGIYGD